MTNPGQPAQSVINAAKAGLQSTQSISFPEDLGKFFMSFDFYDYRTLGNLPQQVPGANTRNVELTRNLFSAERGNVQQSITRSSIARVSLPIPANLVDMFRVDWENISTGLAGTVVSEVIQGVNDTFDTVASRLGQLANGAAQGISGGTSIGSLQNGIGSGTTSSAGMFAIGAFRAGLGGINSGLPGLVDLSLGVTENPNLAVIFKGPTLKQHQFSWKMTARTPSESRKIEQIIAIFKRAMHPQKLNASTSGFLKYPAECLPAFNGPNGQTGFLYPLRPSVVEDFTINYGPHGMPSFYQGTFSAVTVEISVKLQETSYYTRESFDDANEIGSDGFQSSSFGFQSPGANSSSANTTGG